MSTTKNQFERYRKIHDRIKLRTSSGATLNELIELCNRQKSQIKADISYMRAEYDAPIVFDRKQKAYVYTEDFELSIDLMLSRQEFNKIRLAFETLTQLQHLEAYKDFEGIFYKIEKSFKFQSRGKQRQFIHFEKVPSYKGTAHINFFLEAMEFTKEVSFDYHSFKSGKTRNHTLEPYAIKEHTNRWYVIGNNTKKNSITTFALDRIKGNLAFTNAYYEIPLAFDVNHYLKNVVGLTVYNGKSIEEIKLHFTPLQSQYFLSKPFHEFNKICQDENGLIVTMNIIPNYELKQKLASFGSGVKILAPASLIEDFKDFLKSSLARYD